MCGRPVRAQPTCGNEADRCLGNGGGASLKRNSYRYGGLRVHVDTWASYAREKWVGKEKETPCSIGIPKKKTFQGTTTHYSYRLGPLS